MFPKGRGIRSCYHLMFPKRSHAPAHGVLIIKDPGISNGRQFRHSLLTFSGYLRSRFRCAAPGCIQKKKSARLSSTGSFLCGADPIPTCSLHRFFLYRFFKAAIWVIIGRFQSFVKSGSPEIFTFRFLPSSTLPFINFNATIKLTKSSPFGEEAS